MPGPSQVLKSGREKLCIETSAPGRQFDVGLAPLRSGRDMAGKSPESVCSSGLFQPDVSGDRGLFGNFWDRSF
jgi:hypothetical protein